MHRRGTLIIIIVLFLGLGALGYYLQQKNAAYVATPFATIPPDAGFLIEAMNLPDLLEELVEKNEIVNEISRIEGLSGFSKSLEVLDSLIHTRELRTIAGSNPVLISFHLLGKERLVPFYAIPAPPDVKERHIREFLNKTASISYKVTDYEKQKIFEISLIGTDRPVLFLALAKGVIIASSSDILLEAGVRQSDEIEDIRSLPGFSRVSSAAGKNDNKAYILFGNFQKIVGLLSGGSERGIAREVSSLASCAELDIYMKSDRISLNGYIFPTDSSHILTRYMGSEPAEFDAYSIIPSNVALFETLTGPIKGNRLSSASEETRYLADIIRPQLDNELTRVVLDIQGQDVEKNRIVLFRLKGRNATERSFRDEIENSSSSRDKFISYKPDDQSEYIIFSLEDDNLTELLCGDFAGSYKGNYALFYENYLVTGKSVETLSKFIYDNILNRTLANNMTYRSFESSMPSRFAYYLYCVPSRCIDLLAGSFSDNLIAGLIKSIESLKKIDALGYQFVASNSMLYNTFSLSFVPEAKEVATAQWESLLDTIVYSKPMFFTNHNTGRKEIFVQDMNNKIYLINSAGRILWKLQMKDKIMGDPEMIDYYKNGKYQILFATSGNLHLIDRNGNYVERYPVKLRSQASNGLAVFDYENSRDYRIFICGTDRLVYAYDKSGNVVKGWTQFKTTGTVRAKVEFFRVSGKDYLVVNDDQNMYMLDRKGEIRVGIKEQVQRASGSQVRITSGSEPQIVLSAADGSLKFVSLTGDVETVKLNDFTPNHIFEYFDIDADGLGEFIFIDKGTIYCYDNDMSKLFSGKTGSDKIIGPYGLVFSSNDKKIGFVDTEHGLIHLIDARGKSVKGFPLRGSSTFSVGRFSGSSSFNLLTGGKDSFLYNYELVR